MRAPPSSVMVWAMGGILLLFLLVVLPASFVIVEALHDPLTDRDGIAHVFSLSLRSLSWAFGVAIVATLVGWLPGRALRHRGWLSKSVVLATGLIPAYASFYCSWRVLRPGSIIGDFAITHDVTGELRAVVLFLALVAWMWPLAAWIVGVRESDAERMTHSLLILDGATRTELLLAAWRGDRAALALAVGAIGLVLFGETTAFDAAQVDTMTSQLRALDAAGAGVREVVTSAIPALLIGAAASIAVAFVVTRGAHVLHDADPPDANARGHHPGTILLFLLPLLLTAAPMIALAIDVAASTNVRSFGALHLRGALNTLFVASMSGVAGGVIAIAGAALVIGGSRIILGWMFAIALIALSAPATIVAIATASLWRASPLVMAVYDSPAIISCAQAARWSAVALGLGMWCGTTLLRSEREAWLIHGGAATDFMGMSRPILLRAAIGGCVVTGVLSATETSVAARLEPPGFDFLAGSLLNAIHYQDAIAVSAAIPWMAGIALSASMFVCVISRWKGRRNSGINAPSLLLLCALALSPCMTGCADSDGDQSTDAAASRKTPPLPTDVVIGRAGRTEGRFETPRAMAIEPSTGCVFVCDKSGRVQRFSSDGAFQHAWRMPKDDNGKPTGLSMGPDGLLYVADTHEHRVMVFDRDGEIVRAIGSYGQKPGEFVYPTDVAFAPDGRLFVSEYGGNDRIQIFDASGTFLRQFGHPGQEVGAFARPQSLVFSKDGSELFVADSCNHRIQVFSSDGVFKRTLCQAGAEPGALAYPYGIDSLDDGTLLVAEFGNCRLQRLDAMSGESLGVWGGGGSAIGRLNAPWAVAHLAQRIFILDTANARIQSMSLDVLMGDTLEKLR
ncbi:MAG: hypothetical protein EXS15_00745 [Phycisphaerales bacterium]|nr:hypothetical protein [Phycisphaerales bacterium]